MTEENTVSLDGHADLAGLRRGRTPQAGILPRQEIRKLIQRRRIRGLAEIETSQLQPASLDLRLGSRAYRVRASFLPGREKSVEQQLQHLKSAELSLDDGAVLERGCVYVVELLEYLRLPDSISALANPKSSTGRLDIFTRLIADNSDFFDTVPSGYEGRLYAEISPRSFSVRVRKGTRLNQIRFRRRNSQHQEHIDFRVSDRDLRTLHEENRLVDGELVVRNGLVLHVDLGGVGPENLVGYRAQSYTDVIDFDNVGGYRYDEFWEPLRVKESKRLILDPNQFYILASKESLHIPPRYAAEMFPIDPTMGEFRVHYAGFFDPGFGFTEHGFPGSRAVLEVRSHEVPFVLEDGQMIGRLAYERMSDQPDGLYGQIGTSNYQGQGLKLSKHFRL